MAAEEDTIRLQCYQGNGGLCGWEGLNDLHRPWQNDRNNGTIRSFGERYTGQRLADGLDLCDGMAFVHNLEASERHLLHGGYGPLGLCIDSAALLQQALGGRCQAFPVLLGRIWRERLLKRSQRVLATAPLGDPQRRALEGDQSACGPASPVAAPLCWWGSWLERRCLEKIMPPLIPSLTAEGLPSSLILLKSQAPTHARSPDHSKLQAVRFC